MKINRNYKSWYAEGKLKKEYIAMNAYNLYDLYKCEELEEEYWGYSMYYLSKLKDKFERAIKKGKTIPKGTVLFRHPDSGTWENKFNDMKLILEDGGKPNKFLTITKKQSKPPKTKEDIEKEIALNKLTERERNLLGL